MDDDLEQLGQFEDGDNVDFDYDDSDLDHLMWLPGWITGLNLVVFS